MFILHFRLNDFYIYNKFYFLTKITKDLNLKYTYKKSFNLVLVAKKVENIKVLSYKHNHTYNIVQVLCFLFIETTISFLPVRLNHRSFHFPVLDLVSEQSLAFVRSVPLQQYQLFFCYGILESARRRNEHCTRRISTALYHRCADKNTLVKLITTVVLVWGFYKYALNNI